jgi:hypothetical protein
MCDNVNLAPVSTRRGIWSFFSFVEYMPKSHEVTNDLLRNFKGWSGSLAAEPLNPLNGVEYFQALNDELEEVVPHLTDISAAEKVYIDIEHELAAPSGDFDSV